MRYNLIPIILSGFLIACGDSDAPQEKSATPQIVEEKAVQLPADIDTSATQEPVASMPEAKPAVASNPVYLPNQVVYKEEIYKDWPYTEAPVVSEMQQMGDARAEKAEEIIADMKQEAQDTMSDMVASAEEKVAEVVANANPQTHTINAQARIFKPDTIYINPGDTVRWTNMTSHNTVSVEGLIPEGATPWASKLGENLKLQLDVEGVYAYVCVPHIGFGMVGIIVVGKPDNLEEVTQYARDNLKGPFRRLIGKLIKVKIPS